MVKTLVNLTHQAVIAKIETVLDSYPYHPHRQAFANPDLRQELIAYVLTRIPCTYGALNEQSDSLLTYNPNCYLDRHIQLESLVHQGICCILQEKADWVSSHIPEPIQCNFEPSHWFG